MKISGIKFTTIGVADVERNRELFCAVTGMEVAAKQVFSGADWERLWQLPAGAKASGLLLRHPGVEGGGIRLLRFDPYSEAMARQGAEAWDTGAVKILDFITNNHARATQLFDQHGFRWRSPAPNRYELPDGSETLERHIETDDGVILGVPQVFGQPRSKWVAAPDSSLFSEAANSSMLVNDFEAALEFYRDLLGLRVMEDLSITSEELQKLIGLPAPVTLRMAFLQGAETLAGKVGLLNYSGITGRSLKAQAGPPRRGAIMLTFETDDLDELERRLRANGAEIIGADGVWELAPLGRRRFLTARGPEGVFLEFFA
jgi:catechol 2,3-dioxygenase-like lactoylglutathione lyase family enzyme